ncbi:MAG: LysR family transcriptional regulator [Neptuniibacter sp.]
MDSISELNFFVLLVEMKSLAATAREMDLTPSAVTKRLTKLEDRLGVKLLNRTTRKISLTNEGEIYLEHAKRIVNDVAEVEAMITSSISSPKGLLRVNAPLGFGRNYISPIMSEFAALYPDIDLQLELTDRPISLAENAFDVQIRFGEIPDSRLLARHIASNRRLICASPKYLEKHGIPTTASDLSGHSCIVIKQNESEFGTWRLRRKDKTDTVKVNSKFVTNDGAVALRWALDGHGILMRAEWDLAQHIRSGELVLILPDYETPPADIYAVYLQKISRSAKLAAFIKHLEESFLTSDINQDGSRTIW